MEDAKRLKSSKSAANSLAMSQLQADKRSNPVVNKLDDESEWREVSRDDFQSNEANPFDYSICILEKHN